MRRRVAPGGGDVIATSLSPDAAGIAALSTVMESYADFAPLAFRIAHPFSDAIAEQAETAAESAKAIYREVRQNNPDIDEWATPSGAESLQECADHDLLFPS